MDRYPDLDPDAGELLTAELVVTDDVLVKAFALGPGAEVEPHEHADQTNASSSCRTEARRPSPRPASCSTSEASNTARATRPRSRRC
jgi:hypothetical protein